MLNHTAHIYSIFQGHSNLVHKPHTVVYEKENQLSDCEEAVCRLGLVY